MIVSYKEVRMAKLTFLVSSIIVLTSHYVFAQSEAMNGPGPCDAGSRTVVVPEVHDNHVVIDGLFSKGEWDDAVRFPISEHFDICLKSNSGDLFIGLKSAKPVGVVVSELWITSNDKDICHLHSSMTLAEGKMCFPIEEYKPSFVVDYSDGWEASCMKYNRAKHEGWIASGQPKGIENYDVIFDKLDGVEYKISQSKFSGSRVKLRIVLREPEQSSAYPKDADLKSAQNWVKLLLPHS
jgi:hypothetical protein